MPKMKHGKQAFTLIELLVVICIIAILAAMLLPALQSARDSAATATCVNNLMQFSKAYQMYATTYNDFVPAKTAPFYSGGGSGCAWENALIDVMGQAGSSSFRQSFYCEADASLDDSANTGSKKSYSLNNLSDAVHPYIPYTLDNSGKLKDLTGKYKGFISGNRTTSVHTASDLIVIGENCAKNNTIGNAAYSVSDVNACTGTSSSIQQAVAIYQRLTTHKTGGHLFLDGHAQHVKPEKTLPSDKSNFKNVGKRTSMSDGNPTGIASQGWGSWTDCPERKKGNSCTGTCYD